MAGIEKLPADAERERNFILLKPDAVQRGLIGEIIKRFEQKGLKLVGLKFLWAGEDILEKHYSEHAGKPFYPGLINYMQTGPIVPMVWEGLNAVKTGRQMMGETDPAQSQPGTIRGDYCIEIGRNLIHGSDAVDAAKKEIALWFTPEEIIQWTCSEEAWMYE